MKFLCSILFIAFLHSNILTASPIKGNKMTKIIQVEISGADSSKEAEQKTNKFLIDKRISKENLIDIKISRGNYISVMIIYQINYEE